MKVTFKIEYQTTWGETLSLVIGEKRIPMCWTDGGVWSVTVDKIKASDLSDYGYVVMKDSLVDRVEWMNHKTEAPKGCRELTIEDKWLDCPIPGCPFPRRHQALKFDQPGFRGAGTAVPIFSLRTAEDFGIGEFRDLRPLVDWAVSTKQTIIQLLPINDTTRNGGWRDSYPYSPISSFALHPLYIHLQDLGIEPTPAFRKVQAELNSLAQIDYPKVYAAKIRYIRKAYDERGAKDLATAAYKRFHKENAFWLDEYSQFCAQRDNNEPEFHSWIQYHLDLQLSEEVAYARSRNISLKGDLPIGVSADSADAYFHPELFHLDSSAGAPPDFFSEDGQNWGFPTYNWDEMAKDNFKWWRLRLKKMASYFDAYRIDHILGFFRIWEIPVEETSGKFGHFNPAIPYPLEQIKALDLPLEGLFHPDPRHEGCYQPLISPDRSQLAWWAADTFNTLYNDFFFRRNDDFWRRNAERKLAELLSASGMLACGEDLGMIPDCVPGVMDHWKILSLEMSCMDKGRPWPYLSVCATSSHDLPPLRMASAERCGDDLEPWEIRRILLDHLLSASILAIFPIQDWIALDSKLRKADWRNERINQPADSDNKWRYRFHLPLEVLNSDEASEFRVQVESLIRDSSRA